MDMKWIGALFLIIASTSIGLYISNQFEKRPKHIRQLESALQLLEAEITYSQTPLQVAFDRIAAHLPHPMKDFFSALSEEMAREKDFMEVWNREVDRLAVWTSLKTNEIEIMRQFGNSLGQHDIIQQQKQIRLALTHLNREMEEARDEHYKYSKLARSLGVLLGVFLAILLV